jgi:hypothetical protein
MESSRALVDLLMVDLHGQDQVVPLCLELEDHLSL